MTNQIEFTDTMQPIIELMYSQIRMEQENEIMRAVQSMGVNVDKDRLTQALTDAHRFWHEGYAAGRRCKPDWISVEERLPEPDTDVLARRSIGTMDVEVYHEDEVAWTWDGYSKGFVTHWMPLPEPPKEEV